jgi:hypothetical protein
MPSAPCSHIIYTIVNTTSEPPSNFQIDVTSSFRFDIGGLLFYVVIGAGSVMVIALALCLMGLYVSLCYKERCKRKFIAAYSYFIRITYYSLFLTS